MHRRIYRLLLLLLGAWGLPGLAHGQQVTDPHFNVKVAHPVYAKNGPKVLFDEAHFNFHTAGGRYKPFADLITNDGYRVTSNKEKFAARSLNGADVLVIENACAAATTYADQRKHAFTDGVCCADR